MAGSEKRQQANRKNALKATGPRTARGKSMSRLNAAKHGLTSKHLFLNPGYDDDEMQRFDELFGQLIAELQPVGILESKFVEKIAECFIRAERSRRCEVGEICKITEGLVFRSLMKTEEERDTDVATLGRRIMDAQRGATREADDTEYRIRIEKEDNARQRLQRSTLGLIYLRSVLDRVLEEVESGIISSFSISRLVALFGVTAPTTTEIGGVVAMGHSFPENDQSVELSIEEKTTITAIINKHKQKLATLLETVEAIQLSELKGSKLAAAIPETKVLDRILRYSAANDRELYRALGQLERLQRARAGEFVPPPLKVDGT